MSSDWFVLEYITDSDCLTPFFHSPGCERTSRASIMSWHSSGMGNSRLNLRKSFRNMTAVLLPGLCSKRSIDV